MMTLAIVLVAIGLAVVCTMAFIDYRKDINNNNAKAIKWANKMEKEHNVKVALYEDNSGKIVDYKIYKL